MLLSQILAMNFCSLTTRGHSPITWTLTPHSQLQITQGLHFPSSTAPTQLFALIRHTPENNLTSPSPNHTHYINSGLSLALCRVLLTQLHTKPFPVSRVRFPVFPVSRVRFPVFPVSRVRFPVSWFLHVPGLFSLPSPLDKVRRSPTHACPWIILCPVFVIPVCHCPTLPVLTMYYNKSLQMDPHVSRLVSPVTDYSATQGSSAFMNNTGPVCTLQDYYYPSSRVSDHLRTSSKNI